MNDEGAISRGYPAGTYERVLIIAKTTDDELTKVAKEQVIAFCNENDVPWTEDDTVFNLKKLLIVAIGGDGTMLSAMRTALDQEDAIVCGFNTGTLGFLTDTYTGSVYKTLTNISRRHGMVEERMALQGRVYLDGEVYLDNNPRMVATNELILSSMTNQYPIKVKVSINKKMVSENIGSGVLVATSTGSTAMALSAGGAIVSPSTNIMQVVPLMAHTLTSRPVITTGRDTVSLKTKITHARQATEVYGDGNALATFYKGDGDEVELRINKHPKTVRIYRPENWDFFNVLREKMKW